MLKKVFFSGRRALANILSPEKRPSTPVSQESVKKPSHILIYRNQDEKVHSIPIEEFEQKVGISYTDSLLFQSSKLRSKIVEKCAHKIQKRKNVLLNAWVSALHEKAMDNPPADHVYVRWINRHLGYGVFAARALPALTFVGEYTGTIKRRNNWKDRFNDYIFSYDICGSSSRFVVDARHTGNFTRFVNHSDDPNLVSRWIVKDGLIHIILFTSKRIPAHTQLTYCYGPWYWRCRAAPVSL